jgi:Integrase core domain.
MKGIILTMKEQRVNDVIVKLIAKEIKVSEASRLLGLTQRQVYRKKKKYIESGIESIPHKSRGKPTYSGFSKEVKDNILNLYKDEYPGWNFSHFKDTLEDYHNIKVSYCFIYNLLTLNGFDSPRKYRQKKQSHPPRERKENAGELIQVDASKHKWFYNDDAFYHLHGGIDDSTGIVTGGFFSKEETIYGYQMVLYQTLKNYGIPICLYTDYRTIFQSSKKDLTLEEELKGKQINNTRFTNMLNHLGIDILSTEVPQAKGKIERLWNTFQDRLYKELKKNGINTLEKANEYLINVFIPKHNARFAFQLDNTRNLFICLDKSFDYNKELAVFKEYRVYHNSYLKYDKTYKVIMDNENKAYINSSGKVKVYTFLDGSVHVLFNDKYYSIKEIKHIDPLKTIKPDTSLMIKNIYTPKPSNNHPWKNVKPIPNSLRVKIEMFKS